MFKYTRSICLESSTFNTVLWLIKHTLCLNTVCYWKVCQLLKNICTSTLCHKILECKTLCCTYTQIYQDTCTQLSDINILIKFCDRNLVFRFWNPTCASKTQIKPQCFSVLRYKQTYVLFRNTDVCLYLTFHGVNNFHYYISFVLVTPFSCPGKHVDLNFQLACSKQHIFK